MRSRMSTLPSLLLLVCLFSFALPAHAATSKLSCELTVTTQNGSITIDEKETIFVSSGEVIEIAWESTNAKKAFDDAGDEIETEGEATTSLKKDATLTYVFENGTKKTECEVNVKVVRGTFKESTLTTSSVKPTLSGEVTGSKTVRLQVYKEGSEKLLFTSKLIKVKNGTWTTKVTKSLSKGEYDLVLVGGDKKIELNTIATSTLTIGSKKVPSSTVSSDTTFYAESVPLLNGGIAKSGTTVPVLYLQVINIGKTDGVVENFSIKQIGNASTDSVVGFTVSDSKSTAITTVGSTLKPVVFKNGVATVPVVMPIKAGESKLVTIKAIIAPNIITNLTKQLKFDVIGIGTNATQKATFPIKGTTWTLGL